MKKGLRLDLIRGASSSVLVFLSISPALADCANVSPTAIECSGVDGDGLTVNPAATDLRINQNARVAPPIGTAIRQDTWSGTHGLAVVNRGEIVATLVQANSYAVNIPFYVAFQNAGYIQGIGGGGVALAVDQRGLNNSGTITATATAAALWGYLDNTGTIRSTGGTAVVHNPVGGTERGNRSRNSGLIEGASLGMSIYGTTLVNEGTIRSTTGIAIDPNYSSTIDNRAGGLIEGRTKAIARQTYGSGAIILNAGTIRGDVDFGGLGFPGGTGDIFIDNGGTVEGRLVLGGADDLLVVDLNRNGPFAGVTGTVDAGGGFDTIRYRVGSNATAAIVVPASFEYAGYELSGGAALTLSKAGVGSSLTLGGVGSVDLTADLAATDRTVLDLAPLSVRQLGGLANEVPDDLSVVSRGTLSYSSTSQFCCRFQAAVSAGTADFTNVGTLRVTRSPTGEQMPTGIFNGSVVTNVGDIVLSGAIGVSNSQRFLNSGRIVGVSNSSAIQSVAQVENSGSISVDGVAVRGGFGASVLTNSGTIRSTAGTAVSNVISISNLPGGVIRGNGYAVYSDSATTLDNQGTIVGNVQLGSPFPFSSSGRSTYISGGTIQGNLAFGIGSDVFVQTGEGTGVTGSIDAGGGTARDIYARTYNRSASIALGSILPATFEDEMYLASGSGTSLTLTGSSASGGRVLIGGDGGFVNQANIGGSLVFTGIGDGAYPSSFVNQGRIAEGFYGPVARFTNDGFIGQEVVLGAPDGVVAINNGTIDGYITFGNADDIFDNRNGSATAGVAMYSGNDRLIVSASGLLDGYYDGGSGDDTLEFASGGTAAAPASWEYPPFYDFEHLVVSGGVLALSGDQYFSDIDVSGGRLIGAAGSVLTADRFTVAPGATFGSAGTVNGDVVVSGNLAPGASPGIMTVNGNVTLAAGSSSTFEFVPAPGQSDLLLISGRLTIGANTTLNMTGNRMLTPGVNYDVIVADGGITGTFTTVNKPATIGGILRYTANRLQLMGTFLSPAGLPSQQAAAVAYINQALIDGQASTALLAAVPSLLGADGTASAGAFRLITAEPYASASQLGIENALTIAQAGRTGLARTTREENGPFAFGQGMGDWRTLKGDGAVGTSRARSQSWGVLGGVGYGAGGASIGAFIGRLDSKQHIDTLGAKTDGDGMIAGLAAQFATVGFEFSLLGAYDWTKVDTDRAVPAGQVASSDYKLRSLVLDASVSHLIAVGDDWAVRPELGITHVKGHRGSASETGSAAFALNIDQDRFSATFFDGSIALKGGQSEGATFHPWLQAGLRRQIEGDLQAASAAFVGTTSRFTVLGASRKKTVVTAGAGFGYDLGAITMFAAYQGEFGGGNGHNANIGARFSF